MYTIGQLAKQFSISRSTLLYYDSIGVLSPGERNNANYRLYTQHDIERMEKIVMFRNAGLSLEAIKFLLDQEGCDLDVALENRLTNINAEIQSLRQQQNLILKLLKNSDKSKLSRSITKEVWISLLKAAGLDEAGMEKWHIEFERTSPQGHQDFLESIGIEKDEIDEIRAWSRKNDTKTSSP